MTPKQIILARLFIGFGLGLALSLGAVGLVVQARAQLSSRTHQQTPSPAVVLAQPSTPKPATPTPTAHAKAAPTPTAGRTPTPRVTPPATPVPMVTPAPGSSVNNLVPTTPVATPTPGPTNSPTPSPTSSPGGTPVYAYTSTNWSGYLASSGTFTSVSGSWTVPNVQGNGSSTSADATWIGIGGVTSQDLIQTGTDDTVTRNGQVSTTAFYELLPATETPINSMTVTPGDAMQATITQLSGSQWQISLTDVSRSEPFTIVVSYNSSKSTAEWIEEDPSSSNGQLVPFDNFGLVNFSGATMTENGAMATLTGAGAQAIEMVNGQGQPIARPSTIGSDGKSFSVTGGG